MSKKQREQQQRKEKETSIPLQKDSRSQSKKQSHPNELSENSRKGDICWGERPEKERRLVELVGDQNPGSKALSRIKIRRERKGDVRGGAMKKSRYLRVLEREEVRAMTQSNAFSPPELEAFFES